LKAALARITSQKGVQGARVQLKGRLDGIEIARTEWMQKGRLPRQTLRSEIDYGEAQAYCSYGVVGAKVWIFKGEKFE
jgi:small subunit ribosomal protein S3